MTIGSFSMKITVLDGYALNPGDLSWQPLGTFGDVEIFDRTAPHETVERARGSAALLTNKTALTAEVIAQLPELRYIGVIATGYNVIDIEAARARGIVVSNVPTYGTASVAQFTFALLLELCHRVALHSEEARTGGWTRNPDWSYSHAPQIELVGKTMGIVGYGRIGRKTAQLADAFGMRVMPYDIDRGSLDDLLAESDVVSLHVPLFPETREMINAGTLALMKPTAYLINTSRGPLINERDLADALNSSRIAGAALDVLSVEPPPADHPLLSARNCIVTPHMAWSTTEARRRLMQIVIENVSAFCAGSPQNVVT
jgi:glycerate dehydrogenase